MFIAQCMVQINLLKESCNKDSNVSLPDNLVSLLKMLFPNNYAWIGSCSSSWALCHCCTKFTIKLKYCKLLLQNGGGNLLYRKSPVCWVVMIISYGTQKASVHFILNNIAPASAIESDPEYFSTPTNHSPLDRMLLHQMCYKKTKYCSHGIRSDPPPPPPHDNSAEN